MSTPAFKEWAAIVRALLAGEQIVDVRKGGIHEDGRHFDVQATRCWLYPTVEHQRADLLKPAYRRWLDDSPPVPDGDLLHVDGWTDIVGVARIDDPAHLDALDSKLIWTRDYAEQRLKWKRRDALWVLAMRAHRLVEPITVPWDDEYAGCSSWVDVAGLPDDPASVESEPALSDESFAARRDLLAKALPDGLQAP